MPSEVVLPHSVPDPVSSSAPPAVSSLSSSSASPPLPPRTPIADFPPSHLSSKFVCVSLIPAERFWTSPPPPPLYLLLSPLSLRQPPSSSPCPTPLSSLDSHVAVYFSSRMLTLIPCCTLSPSPLPFTVCLCTRSHGRLLFSSPRVVRPSVYRGEQRQRSPPPFPNHASSPSPCESFPSRPFIPPPAVKSGPGHLKSLLVPPSRTRLCTANTTTEPRASPPPLQPLTMLVFTHQSSRSASFSMSTISSSPRFAPAPLLSTVMSAACVSSVAASGTPSAFLASSGAAPMAAA